MSKLLGVPRSRSSVDAADLEEIDRLARMVAGDERPALIGCGGECIPLPEPIFRLVVETVHAIQDGRSITLIFEDELCTTQAAANFLGVSRPFLVKLLEEGKIPHHRVGAHRRVYFHDLCTYRKNRDAVRRAGLDEPSQQVNVIGHLKSPTSVASWSREKNSSTNHAVSPITAANRTTSISASPRRT